MSLKAVVCASLLLVLAFAGCTGKTPTTSSTTQASGLGYSLSSAAPLGTTASGIVECGAGYTSHELYDVKITMLEVARGQKAREMMGSASAPDSGLEYVIARVKFEYYARGAPGDCCHELKSTQFSAFSGDGREYPAAAAMPPSPELKGKACAGTNFEGWVVFQVSKDDKKPVAMFSAGVGGAEAIEHGGNVWLRLY